MESLRNTSRWKACIARPARIGRVRQVFRTNNFSQVKFADRAASLSCHRPGQKFSLCAGQPSTRTAPASLRSRSGGVPTSAPTCTEKPKSVVARSRERAMETSAPAGCSVINSRGFHATHSMCASGPMIPALCPVASKRETASRPSGPYSRVRSFTYIPTKRSAVDVSRSRANCIA